MAKAVSSSLFRYERKFVVRGEHYAELESMVKLHPALFSEIFHQRYINNIYLDDDSFKNYRDNIDGSADRVKVRIRWYGDLFGSIEKPVLEFKIKKALVGRKESYKLAGFSLDESFNAQTLKTVFQNSNLPDKILESLRGLNPVLLNCYRRKYFLSKDKHYRITIDNELGYYQLKNNFNWFTNKMSDKDSTIIELKYAYDLDTKANTISSLFPFRMTKSSKYVNGVEHFLSIRG